MNHYKPYVVVYIIFLACLFAAPHICAFFDFHVSDAVEHYELDKHVWEHTNPGEVPFMSFDEWKQMDDEHSKEFFEEFCDQCALSFDPWFEPQKHHNERGSD
jgi:hypothetical protein